MFLVGVIPLTKGIQT